MGYLDTNYPALPDLSFDDARRLVVLERLSGTASARIHAQMISDLDRLERAGRPAPGYAWLQEQVELDIQKQDGLFV